MIAPPPARRRRLTAAIAPVLAAAALLSAAPSAAAQEVVATDFTLVNGASYEPNSRPRGGYLTVFTNGPVTTEHQSFPFVEATPAGVYLEVDNCILGGPPKKLPIIYVGPSGPGTQINVYFPNDAGSEPYGECTSPPVSAVFSNFKLHTADGRDIVKRLTNQPIYPGIKHAAGATANPPDGWHLNPRTGAYTPFTECAADPSRCPVSSGGTPNLLVLLTVGGELRSCNAAGFNPCDSALAPRFRLAPVVDGQVGTAVDHQLVYYGPTGFGSIGEEQANVLLLPGTQAGEYRLSMTVPGLPGQTPQQQIPVRLGPPD